MARKNAFYAQSGGVTAVINASAAGVIEAAYWRIESAFAGADLLLAYSVKANSNLEILKRLRALGAGADIVSQGELHRCLAAGFSPSDVVFAGVGKTEVEMEAALEAGAEDVVANDDGSFDVFTSFEEFGAVRDALDAAGFAAESADVAMIPSTEAELDLDTAQKVVKLIDMLEDLDDVQNVYSNASISDDIMEQLG